MFIFCSGSNEDHTPIILKAGDLIKLTMDRAFAEHSHSGELFVDYENLTKVVVPGKIIFMDNGSVSLVVQSVQGSVINCMVENTHSLPPYSNLAVPGVKLNLPIITNKDLFDIDFALKHNLDIIVVSNVTDGSVLRSYKSVIGM